MRFRPIFIINAEKHALAYLHDQDFPEIKTNKQVYDLIREGWLPNTEEIEFFTVSRDNIIVRFMPMAYDGVDGILLLTQKTPHQVVLQARVDDLDPAQRSVFDLVIQGLTSKQIANQLNRSKRWVDYRTAEIVRILNVNRKTHLRRFAIHPPRRKN
jgi:DNA-binding CsgD family transcriptional regulator